ncbi:aldolase [Verticiella sediminum]|uniref:Aldolase n=1 Tax=Verticiella sediminum TaxID=1247510 RepID=A0A556AXH8_9BURK|nr:aldolase/citrate lyase family protein [Verticiella sediminum]TSH97628.1 aldolase [Verticiella sediminum]
MIYRKNKVLEALKKDRVPVGAFVQMRCPEIVEAAGNADYDYVWIDWEHGSFEMETVVDMIRAAEATGLTPIVRVPCGQSAEIARVLDAGAMGIIVPQVSDAETARQVVAAAKYRTREYDAGRRGACPLIRATGHQTLDWPAYARWANENTTIWLLVETVEGIRNLDEILAVPNVNAIVLGAFDLAVSMGKDGDRHHPEVERVLDGMIERVRRADVDVVGLLFDADLEGMKSSREHYVRSGCRILVAGSDRRIISNSFSAIRGLVA